MTNSITLRGPEQRAFPRWECCLDLELRNDSGTPGQPERVEAVDLSLIGVGLQRMEWSPFSTPLRVGQSIEVVLPCFSRLKAEVKWVHDSRFGVQFRERLSDILDSWVGEVLAAQRLTMRDLMA